MVAEVGFEPHGLLVMSQAGTATPLLCKSQRSGSNRPRTPYEGGMAPCHLAAVVNARGVDPRFALAREPSSGRRPGLRSWSRTWESNPVISSVSGKRLTRLARASWYFGQDSNLRPQGVDLMLNHLSYRSMVVGVGLEPTISCVSCKRLSILAIRRWGD